MLVSRWLLLISVTIVPLSLFVEKDLVYRLVRTLHSRGYGIEKVLIYGSGSTGRRVFSALRRLAEAGIGSSCICRRYGDTLVVDEFSPSARAVPL